MRLLVAEDNRSYCRVLTAILEHADYTVDAVYDGTDAFEYALANLYDGIILDVMMPGMDGVEVVKRLRERGIPTPVMMLTAKTQVGDRIEGYDAGADDYMSKPFHSDELLARVRALSRRTGEVIIEELTFADISLKLNSYDLSCNGKTVHLGFKEFEILKLMMSNPNQVFSKDEIITRVWGYLSEAEDNNVEVYISFLRKKLKYLKSGVAIRNIQKIGYRLEADGA